MGNNRNVPPYCHPIDLIDAIIVPDPVYWLLPAMMGSWAIGVMLAFRRYR